MPRATDWRTVIDAALAETGIDRLAERAIETLMRENPLLRDDPDLRELARRSSAANLALVAEVARGNLGLGEVEPPAAAGAFARELARRNVPMAELARDYRAVQHVLWRFGVDELRRRIPDAAAVAVAIEEYTDATFATGDVFMDRALERYARERDLWVRSADAVRRASVEEVLAGEPVDADQASRRLRYELRRTHLAFVVWARDEDAAPDVAAAAIGGPRALTVSLTAGTVAGWCAPEALEPAAGGEHVGVAVGEPAAGIAGFRRSHAEALEARRLAGDRPGPVHYRDIALAALLTHDAESARAFAERELGALAGHERLETTVLALLEAQGSPRRAAAALGVHENTVAKRVRAAEEKLGQRVAERPVELATALLISRAS